MVDDTVVGIRSGQELPPLWSCELVDLRGGFILDDVLSGCEYEEEEVLTVGALDHLEGA